MTGPEARLALSHDCAASDDQRIPAVLALLRLMMILRSRPFASSTRARNLVAADLL